MNQQSLCPFQKCMGVLFLEKVSHFLKVLRFWSLYESRALRVESIVNSQWYSGSASSFAKRVRPRETFMTFDGHSRPPLRSFKMCCRCHHVYEFHSFQSCSTYSGQRRKTLHPKLIQVMEPQAWGYYSSGGDDEITLRDNHMVSMAEEIQVMVEIRNPSFRKPVFVLEMRQDTLGSCWTIWLHQHLGTIQSLLTTCSMECSWSPTRPSNVSPCARAFWWTCGTGFDSGKVLGF